MTLPTTDTVVTYPDGGLTASATVVHVEPTADGRFAVLLDRTSAHPVDTAWPDQPADRGVLRFNGDEVTLTDVVAGGIRDGSLLLGAELPVRQGTPEWTFVVAHLVEGVAPAEGDTVEVEVDAEYRAALSVGHTACHLASLALDAALAEAWTKQVPTDALGNPGFDGLAIQTSRIHPHGSTDVYRIGKSLRKKGFDVTALENPAAIAARANARLAAWVAEGAAVHIARAGDALSARRTWVCEFSDGHAEIPCGGTHVADIRDLARVEVTLEAAEVEGGRQLTMTTTVART